VRDSTHAPESQKLSQTYSRQRRVRSVRSCRFSAAFKCSADQPNSPRTRFRASTTSRSSKERRRRFPSLTQAKWNSSWMSMRSSSPDCCLSEASSTIRRWRMKLAACTSLPGPASPESSLPRWARSPAANVISIGCPSTFGDTMARLHVIAPPDQSTKRAQDLNSTPQRFLRHPARDVPRRINNGQ